MYTDQLNSNSMNKLSFIWSLCNERIVCANKGRVSEFQTFCGNFQTLQQSSNDVIRLCCAVLCCTRLHMNLLFVCFRCRIFIPMQWLNANNVRFFSNSSMAARKNTNQLSLNVFVVISSVKKTSNNNKFLY